MLILHVESSWRTQSKTYLQNENAFGSFDALELDNVETTVSKAHFLGQLVAFALLAIVVALPSGARAERLYCAKVQIVRIENASTAADYSFACSWKTFVDGQLRSSGLKRKTFGQFPCGKRTELCDRMACVYSSGWSAGQKGTISQCVDNITGAGVSGIPWNGSSAPVSGCTPEMEAQKVC